MAYGGQGGDLYPDGYGQGGHGPGGRHGHRRPRGSRRSGFWGGFWGGFGRRPLFGLGLTGAGLAAVAIAAVVGVGQLGGGQAACTGRGSAAMSASSMSAYSMSASSMSLAAMSVRAGTVSGIATHYVLTGLPNCGYPSPPSDGYFVALSPSEYDSAAACGGYITVTGPDGSVTAEVIDQCPECASGHIDLSEPAFAKLAPLAAGLINVHYQYLTDPALPGPVTMEVKSGSSAYWLALLAGNTGNPLASVQVQTSSGGWVSLARANYNYWIAQSGAGSGPFTVRLTDTAGHVVTVRNVALDPGAVQSTGVYMYGGGSDPQPAPSSAPSSGAPTATGSATMSPTASSASPTSSASRSPGRRSSRARSSSRRPHRVRVRATVPAAPAAAPAVAPTFPPTPSSTC